MTDGGREEGSRHFYEKREGIRRTFAVWKTLFRISSTRACSGTHTQIFYFLIYKKVQFTLYCSDIQFTSVLKQKIGVLLVLVFVLSLSFLGKNGKFFIRGLFPPFLAVLHSTTDFSDKMLSFSPSRVPFTTPLLQSSTIFFRRSSREKEIYLQACSFARKKNEN